MLPFPPLSALDPVGCQDGHTFVSNLPFVSLCICTTVCYCFIFPLNVVCILTMIRFNLDDLILQLANKILCNIRS